eukprot:CAMPEP_0117567752 /NCGR_PEP_ID=MMETSP0784-20121206/57770_1 /TAXON_ID=39447 /ORGANISM="" /LENGTH=166 /DNA_ID=CAMNT_0005365635 /DNA_START=23 /DNA_END=520 /DNA_ORIENTATION=+
MKSLKPESGRITYAKPEGWSCCFFALDRGRVLLSVVCLLGVHGFQQSFRYLLLAAQINVAGGKLLAHRTVHLMPPLEFLPRQVQFDGIVRRRGVGGALHTGMGQQRPVSRHHGRKHCSFALDRGRVFLCVVCLLGVRGLRQSFRHLLLAAQIIVVGVKLLAHRKLH